MAAIDDLVLALLRNMSFDTLSDARRYYCQPENTVDIESSL
jgi:hypothetical protein